MGTQLREKILESLAKAQEPPPPKQKKPLPAPDDRAKPKRGGKRFRRMKEKCARVQILNHRRRSREVLALLCFECYKVI